MSKAGPLEIGINEVEGRLKVYFLDDEQLHLATIGNLRLDTNGVDFFHLHDESLSEIVLRSISEGYKVLFCPQCGLRIVLLKSVVNFTDLRIFLKNYNQKSGG